MTYPTKFDDLRAQLAEIYAALQNKEEGKELPLYAYGTPRETLIVFRGSLAGRAVEQCDKARHYLFSSKNPHTLDSALKSILTIFFNSDALRAYNGRQQRFLHHMREVEQLWGKAPSAEQNRMQRRCYFQYLAEELNGSVAEKKIYMQDFDHRRLNPLTGEEVRNHRQTVISFHQATYIFWSIFVKEKGEDLCQPLLKYLNSSSTLTDRPLYKALRKEGKWVNVESVMGRPIPVALFSKLHDPKSLTVSECSRLRAWVKKINSCQQEITLKTLSMILREVVTIVHVQGFSPLTLQDLLYWLDKEGCSILHSEDPAHMDWREGLKPGDSVTCNGKELILGKRLSPHKKVHDEFKVFELADYPDYVVMIANNCERLLIEAREAQSHEEHWGVRLVETIANIEEDDQLPPVPGLDAKGCCVVLEKLSSPLDSHKWTSDKEKLVEKDEKIALVLANHLFCMHQWRANSQKLSLPHLMFDQDEVLKSVRLLKKGPPNYNEWEAVCSAASKGNLFVLAFLMNVSKLSEHPVGIYYREAVEHALDTGETDLISRPLPLGHSDAIYDKRVKEICSQALELRETCLQHVIAELREKGSYSYKQQAALEKKVAERLLHFYGASHTPGILFSEQLLTAVVDSFSDPKWDDRILDLSDDSDYYQEKHDLMMSYNKAARAVPRAVKN